MLVPFWAALSLRNRKLLSSAVVEVTTFLFPEITEGVK